MGSLLNEIASDYEVYPNMLTRWKTDAINNFHLLFENESAKIRKQSKEYEAQIDELHRQIGILTAQYDWMKKIRNLITISWNDGLWLTFVVPIYWYPYRLKCLA